jgi:bacillithiol biosynthesis cysteine-adding enzyme BshC
VPERRTGELKTFRIRYSDLPSTSKLFKDFIYSPGVLAPWVGSDFRDPIGYRQTADQLVRADFSRSELGRILSAQNHEFGAPEETLSNVELIRNRDAHCVVTGQQVGLLGGPILSLYKAITVIKLARKLSDLLAHPVVPLFWLATDDHDLAEVDHVLLPTEEGKLEKISYEPVESADGRPMASVSVDSSIRGFLDRVSNALADTEFKSELLDLLKSCYSEGSMIFAGFARLLLHHLGKHGLVVVNPADTGLRSLAKDVFRREVTEFEATRKSIKEANGSLLDAGYHLQVTRAEQYTNLFMCEDKRSRIGYRDGRFYVDGAGREYSRGELLDTIEKAPDSFSPNVLLRLIVQSRLFPAVAFVGGPAEIAYFAQVKGLFPIFDVVPPIVHPRLSATMIERHWASFMEEHDIELSRLPSYSGREAYLTSILDARFPKDIDASLQESQERTMAEIAKMRDTIKTDSGLVKTFEQTRKKIDYELNSFRSRVLKGNRKAHDGFSEKFRRLAEHLFPEQLLQERHYNLMYFANKYGPAIVDTICNRLDAETYEHQVVRL